MPLKIQNLDLKFHQKSISIDSLLLLVGSKDVFQTTKFTNLGTISTDDKDLGTIYELDGQICCILDPKDVEHLQRVPNVLYKIARKLIIIDLQQGSPNDDTLPIYFSTKTKMDTKFDTIGGISANILQYVYILIG